VISAELFFRGDFLARAPATKLLEAIAATLELRPEYWNVYEPINVPFRPDRLDEILGHLVQDRALRSVVFFVRKASPKYLLTLDLQRWPVQGGSGHNHISLNLERPWQRGEQKLVEYCMGLLRPDYPDYAYLADASGEDYARFQELENACTTEEVKDLLAGRPTKDKYWFPPFRAAKNRRGGWSYWFVGDISKGPKGCLTDVAWFNYFGKAYVDLIGESRLSNAGWTRVERLGEGLACYATDKIDDPGGREKRSGIVDNLQEFFWTPGCDIADKRAPIFDFSEQLAALTPEMSAMLAKRKRPRVHFAGFSPEEEKQARAQLGLPDENEKKGSSAEQPSS
jgi:hypothetical protein